MFIQAQASRGLQTSDHPSRSSSNPEPLIVVADIVESDDHGLFVRHLCRES